MALYPKPSETPERFGIKRKGAVTTVGIYIEDKPAFIQCKSLMLKMQPHYNDPDVIQDLLQSWFYQRNDAS